MKTESIITEECNYFDWKGPFHHYSHKYLGNIATGRE